MPPKKPVTGTKPAAAKGPAKVPAKGPAKASTTKTGATAKTTPAKTTDAKGAAPPKPVVAAVVKKVLVPEEIGLKEIAAVVALTGDVGTKLKDSGRWLYIIDRNGNVGTFLKYRNVNMISVTNSVEFQPEPMRKALMGSLCFGKPWIIDISDADPTKSMETMKIHFNTIYDGLYDDLMDRSIMDEDKCGKMYNASDDDDYKNPFNYRVLDFQFIILTNTDPASTAMEDFFPVIVE